MSKDTAPKSGTDMRGTGPTDGREGRTPPSTSSRPGEHVKSRSKGASAIATPPAAPSSPPKIGNNGSSARDGHDSSSDDLPFMGAAGLPVSPAAPTTGEYILMARSRRRAWIRLGIFALLVLFIANVVYLGPFSDPAANLPLRKVDPVPLSEVQPYGVNTFLHKEVDSWKKDMTLSMAKDMGAGWIKQQFPWAEIEYRTDPQRPFWDVKNNQNSWTKFDGIVSLAQQYNLRIIARIDSAPLWSHPDNGDGKAPPDAAHLTDFGSFIEAFVERYKGTVAAIQVWNEPNLKGEWATGKPVNAAEYTVLLKTAYEAAKKANPDMIVLAAPLATNNERLEYAGNLNELDYLQNMYDAGAGQYFDAMAANAYGTTYAPEDAPSRDKLNFRRVELLRAIMEKNGDSNKSVWFNEYGWNASPADMPAEKLRWGRVTPEEQAAYTVRGIEYARQHWPWAGVFTIWYLRQVGDTPRTESEYYFGLVSPDFLPTEAYRNVQSTALSTDKVATPGDWGPLSAAVQAPPQWRIRLDSTVPGGMFVSPTALGATLDVPFLGNDAKVTLVPSADDSGADMVSARYYVSIDGNASKVSSDLPRDVTGQAYIDVPAQGKPVEVVISRGINTEVRTGQHMLEIKVAANPAGVQPSMGGGTYAPVVQRPDLPGIGIITIESHRSYLLFAFFTLALAAAIVSAFWLLRRNRPSVEMAAPGR
ncbi:MAG: hypothetical protein ABI670_02950 [Chloroflexota bacterium]